MTAFEEAWGFLKGLPEQTLYDASRGGIGRMGLPQEPEGAVPALDINMPDYPITPVGTVAPPIIGLLNRLRDKRGDDSLFMSVQNEALRGKYPSYSPYSRRQFDAKPAFNYQYGDDRSSIADSQKGHREQKERGTLFEDEYLSKPHLHSGAFVDPDTGRGPMEQRHFDQTVPLVGRLQRGGM